LSSDQCASWIIYTAASASYYLLIVLAINGDGNDDMANVRNALIAVQTVFIAAVVVCWYDIEVTNPEYGDDLPVRCQVVCLKEAQSTCHYCSTCKKYVRGLDHHCTWLNTCIGSRNYVSFLVLSCVSWVQFLLQTVIGVLIQTWWLTGYNLDK
jgi:palmitoyltransferase ZDHHC1/11